MKKISFFFLFFFVLMTALTMGQSGGWTLVDSAFVTNPSVTVVSDTGHSGSSYKVAFTSTTQTQQGGQASGLLKAMGATDTLVSYVFYTKDFGQTMTIPQKISFWYWVPPYTVNKVTRGAVGFMIGNTIYATTDFAYMFQQAGWAYVELTVNAPGGNFSKLAIALSCLPNEGGYRAVFIDDIGADGVIIDNGGGPVSQPVTPTLVAPANNAQYTLPSLPNLQWSSEAADTGYTVQVAADSNFSAVLINNRQKTTSYQTVSLGAGNYWWRVNGLNSGGASAWSSFRKFTVSQQNIPSAPQFGGITNGDTVNATNPPTVSWGLQPNWLVHILLINVTNSPQDTVMNVTLAGTSVALTGLSSCSIYVLQGRYEQNSLSSNWTTIGFVTRCGTSLPQLISPADGAKNVSSENATFVWTPADVTLLIATDPGFAQGTIAYGQAVSGTTKTLQLTSFTTYYWKVGNSTGWSSVRSFFTIPTITGIGNEEAIPKEFALSQNYPNPFNPTTVIQYSVPSTAMVTLKIYDLLGREVATLVNMEKQPGRYEVNFDASKLSSGLYIYRLIAGDFVSVKKMTLLK